MDTTSTYLEQNNCSLDYDVAMHIIHAQAASDGGKGISILSAGINDPSIKDSIVAGYNIKDYHIIKAIECIIRNKRSGFYFYVKNIGCGYIVYFNFKINGVRKQVSFHCFSQMYRKYTKNDICNTRWDHKSSREACVCLHNYMQQGIVTDLTSVK